VRKSIINTKTDAPSIANEAAWLDLEQLVSVELTSEDKAHPIEGAFNLTGDTGWRAQSTGEQTIRLRFDRPCDVRRIHLVFLEHEHQRTQEFLLRWSAGSEDSYRDVVRQQYTFSPPGNSREVEDYLVELNGVMLLELCIVPDISGGGVPASLEQMLIA